MGGAPPRVRGLACACSRACAAGEYRACAGRGGAWRSFVATVPRPRADGKDRDDVSMRSACAPRPCLGCAAGARLTLRHGLPINRPCWPCMFMQRETAGEGSEQQRGRTVNPLAYAFVGSSPTSPTNPYTLKNRKNLLGSSGAASLDYVAYVAKNSRCFSTAANESRRLHATHMRHTRSCRPCSRGST